MIIGKKERYFTPTLYNMVRVINRLAEMAENEGGKVEWREEDVTVHLRDGKGNVRDEIITTKFVSLVSDLWIRFELDGFRYYFEVEDNPFFPDGYTKTPVGWNGKSYIDKIESGDKHWLFDSLFRTDAPEETIDHAAAVLLEQLKAAPDSCA